MPPLLIAVILSIAECFLIGQLAISEYLHYFPQAVGIGLLVSAFGLNWWAAMFLSRHLG